MITGFVGMIVNFLVGVISIKIAAGNFGVKEMSWSAAFKLALMIAVIGGVITIGVSFVLGMMAKRKAAGAAEPVKAVEG